MVSVTGSLRCTIMDRCVARQLRHAIGDRPVIIFVRFDIRILKQTAAAHDPADWLEELTVYCAMELAAGCYGATNRYGTISLACAASQAGLTWEEGRKHIQRSPTHG